MESTRRAFLGTAFAAALAARAAWAQQPRRPTQPAEPRPPITDPGIEDESPLGDPRRAERAMLDKRRQDILTNAERLFDLAEEIRAAVTETDPGKVIPLALVRKAEDAEKTAKKLKSLLRG
jgi:hypothetical protein